MLYCIFFYSYCAAIYSTTWAKVTLDQMRGCIVSLQPVNTSYIPVARSQQASCWCQYWPTTVDLSTSIVHTCRYCTEWIVFHCSSLKWIWVWGCVNTADWTWFVHLDFQGKDGGFGRCHLPKYSRPEPAEWLKSDLREGKKTDSSNII